MNEWHQAERHADRALDFFDRGYLEEAESELRKALAIQPDHPDWQFNLGLTLEAAHRDQEAMEHFERAAELAPGQLPPHLAAGAMALRLQDWAKAHSFHQEAVAIESTCQEAHAGLIEAFVGLGEHEEAETAFYLAEMALEETDALCLVAIATSLIVRKDYKRAEWCLREAIRLNSELQEVHVQLAFVLAETERSSQAIRIFTDLLRTTPDDVPTLLAYARLLVKLQRYPEAIERLERLLRVEPIHLEAHEMLARLSLETHHFDRAIFEFQLVLRLHPMQLSAVLGLADALIATGRFTETRRLLQVVTREWDRYAGSNSVIASEMEDHCAALLLAAGMNEDAAMKLEQSIERSGASTARLRRLALAHFRCGNLDAGIGASRKVLRVEPGCIRSIHNLALSSLMQGRLPAAAVWLGRGLAIHPRDEGLRRLRIRLWAQRILSRLGLGWLVSEPH